MVAELYHLTPLIRFVADASEPDVKRLLDFIDIKDAPILAAATRAHARVLLTLDKRHFIENERLQTLQRFIALMTPGSFIQSNFI